MALCFVKQSVNFNLHYLLNMVIRKQLSAPVKLETFLSESYSL